MPDYIFDTTVLSNFAAVGRIDLLEERYRGIAYITVEVSDELRRGAKAGYAYLEPVLQWTDGADKWIQVLIPQSTDEIILRSQFDDRLGAGESSCLALAICRGLTLVTDDLAARRLAQKQSVPITGTLGILIGLVRTGSLSLQEEILSNVVDQFPWRASLEFTLAVKRFAFTVSKSTILFLQRPAFRRESRLQLEPKQPNGARSACANFVRPLTGA